MGGNKDCHEFRFSNVRIVISVSMSEKSLDCLCHCICSKEVPSSKEVPKKFQRSAKEVPKKFQEVPRSFKKFQEVPRSSKKFQEVPRSSKKFQKRSKEVPKKVPKKFQKNSKNVPKQFQKSSKKVS